MPIEGWYLRSKWIETFRPDGLGHITISDGLGPAHEIAFPEIVCDICNADAGAPNGDGSESSIYFDGANALCRECGQKVEAEVLERVRQMLKRRGWPEFHVSNLRPEVLRAIAHEDAVDKIVGASPDDVAKAMSWDTTEAILWASRLLEAVNEHRLSMVLFKVVERRGGNAQEAGQ